ncbi:ankyrin repeat domain-containing protein [Zavarzinia compransoris]|uniref:Ankyrin repeat domain-containing protein n=1 Tax=Zavarzinia compransoris TaxID=1264899 RepID=A0A317EFB0_9PROT|nr:ankyrin repeat domain-containing protein [Zavarzinia compransoris]PWR23865.1 hypothetical protein DKG75_04720 [Zavarzinia compransoris]TDP48103.1 hypothetical protein DES42_102401 [Zavarzinia compransoris]
MTRLPDRPNIDLLKKQAKDLLAACRRGDPGAFARLRAGLPGRVPGIPELRLHDAQFCLAREYGFPSWAELSRYVAAARALAADRGQRLATWLGLVYAGDICGGMNRASPAAAARLLDLDPDLPGGDPHLACAVGDLAVLRAATARDPGWVGRPGGPLALPPLVAVTHSGLVRLPRFRAALHDAARFLLEAGADPDQAAGSRWPPASPAAPAADMPLSALYGAAGQNRDPALTRLLLAAGADPNDGESLYHALESAECTGLLLAAGARVAGTNALYRALDLDDVAVLKMLLAAGADPNTPAAGAPMAAGWGHPLLWAIRRRRSPAHVEALLAAGADAAVRAPDGTGAYGLALRFGLTEVAEMLAAAGHAEPLSEDEQFIAACAAGDEATARRLQARRPDLPGALAPARLSLLSELAALGRGAAVEVMVRLGWPIESRGGDWAASALNQAVFIGDAAMTRFLLEHGADWQARHGFGDNACGTLSWASVNEPADGGDWPGCAEALIAAGMPGGRPDPRGGGHVLIHGQVKLFAPSVADVLTGEAAAAPET